MAAASRDAGRRFCLDGPAAEFLGERFAPAPQGSTITKRWLPSSAAANTRAALRTISALVPAGIDGMMLKASRRSLRSGLRPPPQRY
jgi:hypothetical protein